MRSTYRIFIVEDNDDHFEIVKGLLSPDDLGVESFVRATSIGEAEEILVANRFDVILLDLSLPDSTPEKTIDRIVCKAPNTAIVVLTSLSDARLAERALIGGAQDYIDKYSLDGETLVRTITHAVERKRILCQLEQKNQELERFAGLLAHEIATPVQAMATALWLARSTLDPTASEGINEAVRLGVEAGNHLRRLINDLLSLATSDSLEAMAQVDMNKIASDAIQYCVMLHPSNDYKIEIQGELPKLVANEVMLKQVLQNLLLNAIRYRRKEFLEIQIYGEESKSDTQVYVRDNGRGIAQEHLESIFSMFYKIDSSEGKGIGLGFCRQVLEKLGGKLWVESQVEVGSIFGFSLPAR